MTRSVLFNHVFSPREIDTVEQNLGRAFQLRRLYGVVHGRVEDSYLILGGWL